MLVCPCCGSEELIDLVELRRCIECDHVFQFPPEVTAVYDKAYVMERYDKYSTTGLMSHTRVGFVKAFADGGKLLDVGYGNGAFVKTAMAAGFDAYGCDVHGADYGVREASLNEGCWDVVTFFDSLEHFPDLSIIRRLARRTKLIVISFPAWPYDFPSNRDWKHYRPGEHLHYFTVSSLKKLFDDKKLLVQSDVEDIIRGKLKNSRNITTAVFTTQQ